jgi:Tfp pilus assembly PilM family ATPase
MKEKLKNTFGLGISNTALTAVELDYGKAGLRVLNYSRVELKPGIIEDDLIIIDPEAFKEALGQLLIEAKNGPISSRNVIISIPEEKIFSHYINIPKEHANDIKFIKQVAQDFIPIDLNESITDCKLMKNKPNDKDLKFNFVAVHKNIIKQLISSLNETGLKVVAVDTKKESLIRFCNNRLQKNEEGFMIVDIDMQTILLCARNTEGISHIIDAKVAGRSYIEKVKEKLKITTFDEIKKLLLEFKKNPDTAQNEKYRLIEQTLQDLYVDLSKKGLNLVKIMENEQKFNLNNIYFIGCLACIPGLRKEFEKTFPGIKITEKLDYIEIEEIAELFYPDATGLAIRTLPINEDEDKINLLPSEIKEELDTKKLMPVILIPMLGTSLIFAGIMIFTGMSLAKNYTNCKISETEKNIFFEQSKNPFLLHTAESRQQETQLENQIKSILSESVPGSQIMSKLDNYNEDGIGLISANYTINSKEEIGVRMRAKSINREETERFITILEEDPYFLEVNSPLSNLVGQGERFINLDLILNSEEIIKQYQNLKQEEEIKQKKPSIQKEEEEIENTN